MSSLGSPSLERHIEGLRAEREPAGRQLDCGLPLSNQTWVSPDSNRAVSRCLLNVEMGLHWVSLSACRHGSPFLHGDRETQWRPRRNGDPIEDARDGGGDRKRASLEKEIPGERETLREGDPQKGRPSERETLSIYIYIQNQERERETLCKGRKWKKIHSREALENREIQGL